MKKLIVAVMAIVWLNSCEAQTPTDPVVPVVTIDPKCLLKTQWSLDYSLPHSQA